MVNPTYTSISNVSHLNYTPLNYDNPLPKSKHFAQIEEQSLLIHFNRNIKIRFNINRDDNLSNVYWIASACSIGDSDFIMIKMSDYPSADIYCYNQNNLGCIYSGAHNPSIVKDQWLLDWHCTKGPDGAGEGQFIIMDLIENRELARVNIRNDLDSWKLQSHAAYEDFFIYESSTEKILKTYKISEFVKLYAVKQKKFNGILGQPQFNPTFYDK